MRKTHILIALLLALSLLAGCGAAAAAAPDDTSVDEAGAGDAGKIRVVATIFPPYDFAREVAGEHVSLTLLLPPGAESHSYEPSPQDIITIQNCDVFIYAGGASDSWIEDILASMDTGSMRVLSMLEMVEAKEEVLVEGMEGGHEEPEDHDHDEVEYDEHVWTSPANAMEIVAGICETLCAVDAANAAAYRANAQRYRGELERLDAAFRQTVRDGARDTLIFGDRFPFRYLADEYGLQYYAAFPGCATQTEPSAATVAFLIDKVREEDIPVVFHIELSSEKMADTICGETGAQKRLMHSCHNVSKDEMAAGASYLSLMQNNLSVLEEALA